jgi:arsenate reductase
MIRAAGYAPSVIEYPKAGWTPGPLAEPLTAMDAAPRDISREKGAPAAEPGLLEPGVPDDQILDAMVAHPILVERPIVEAPRGVKLCRPCEVVFTPLERRPDTVTREDGEVVRDEQGGC